MKLILHIGTDKTGSTAIQKHLYINRLWLLDHGVYIPLTGLGKDTGHMAVLEDLESGQLAELARELATARREGYQQAVISWEGMCFMDPGQIAQLGQALADQDLWLLVYLREQADIVQTGYLQEIKTGRRPVDITDFHGGIWSPSRLRALLYCYSPMRNYARLLRQWMSIIPRGQTIAREFHHDLLANNNVVDDVLNVLRLSADDGFQRFQVNTNISLDVESALIMNGIDRKGVTTLPRKTYAFTLLSLIHSDGFGTRHFLSARRVASIRRFYRRSNSAIGDIIGSSLPALFPDAASCSRTYSPAEIQRNVQSREEKVQRLLAIPMLFTTKVPHDTPGDDSLVSGWGPLQAWGAWNADAVSEIRFRIPYWMMSHEKSSIIVRLKGRYPDGLAQSRVTVNGLDFGRLDLRRFGRAIALPVSALQANQVVSLSIHHEAPEPATESPSESKGLPHAFGIEKLGIQFANPD